MADCERCDNNLRDSNQIVDFHELCREGNCILCMEMGNKECEDFKPEE